jgi:O-antigen/teichoic acid export membrane protein
MDVSLLFLLLPRYGIAGYFASFLITHVINFILSFRRLIKISAVKIPLHIPAITLGCTGVAILIAGIAPSPWVRSIGFTAIWVCLLFLCRVISKQDIVWLKGLICRG